LRKQSSNFARSLKPIEPRHAYVHYDQVWRQFASFVQSILAIDGFAAHLPLFSIGKKGTHPAPNDFVVVNY
jgi:hypothetical protein